MNMLSKTPVTAEQFFALPRPANGTQQELVRGEIRTMPPPGGMHGVACGRIGRRLGNFVDERNLGWVTTNDAGFITGRDPDTVRGPDIAYWSKTRLPEVPVGYIEVAPDLAVEVLSPGNSSAQIREKIQEYFDRGVNLVWVVAPEDRTVTIYRTAEEGRVLHENATLTGEDTLRGFECRVGDLMP